MIYFKSCGWSIFLYSKWWMVLLLSRTVFSAVGHVLKCLPYISLSTTHMWVKCCAFVSSLYSNNKAYQGSASNQSLHFSVEYTARSAQYPISVQSWGGITATSKWNLSWDAVLQFCMNHGCDSLEKGLCGQTSMAECHRGWKGLRDIGKFLFGCDLSLNSC